MKKIVAFLLTACCLLSMPACNDDSVSEIKKNEENEERETKETVKYNDNDEQEEMITKEDIVVDGTMQEKTITAGAYASFAVRNDGTVCSAGDKEYGDVDSWSDIVAVSAGAEHVVGLKSDGTVLAAGTNYMGSCNVNGWRDIVAIAAGEWHTVGLKSDGTVVSTSIDSQKVDFGQTNVSGWTDIIAITAGFNKTVGLKSDGTVVACGTAYTKVVNNHDLVDVGFNEDEQSDIASWENIVAIAICGSDAVVGLKNDGTVVYCGPVNGASSLVEKLMKWENIVAISGSKRQHIVGLKSDGSVVGAGYEDYGQHDFDDWKDVVQIATGHYHTMGLTADGSILVTKVGNDRENHNQNDVAHWDEIKMR